MKSTVGYCLAAVLSVANYCQGISIDVGNHALFANTPGQIVQINVTGLSTDLVAGMDLNVQIGNSPAHNTPPSGPSPTIDYENSGSQDLTNNFFSPIPHLFLDAGSTPYAITVGESVSFATGPDSTVLANGGLVTLIVDTRGYYGGSWPLIMGAGNFNGPTDFIARDASTLTDVSITNGSLYIPVPEPGSIVAGSIALAALGALAIRQRRALRKQFT